MKSVGSKVYAEPQPDETLDLNIPDFLRRPTPTAAQCVETRQQSTPAPSVN